MLEPFIYMSNTHTEYVSYIHIHLQHSHIKCMLNTFIYMSNTHTECMLVTFIYISSTLIPVHVSYIHNALIHIYTFTHLIFILTFYTPNIRVYLFLISHHITDTLPALIYDPLISHHIQGTLPALIYDPLISHHIQGTLPALI